MTILPSTKHIFLFIKTYLLVLTIFTLFRLLLFITELDRVNVAETGLETILRAFVMGIRFDIVISGYILIVPFFVVSAMVVLRKNSTWVFRLVFLWIFIFFSLAFLISAADIPYFNQFFSRFSMGAFEWIDHPGFVFDMIRQEPRYYLILAPFILVEILFYKLLHRIFLKDNPLADTNNRWITALVSLVFLGIIFLGIRGRLEKKSPIRIGTAYFCNDAFLNQLGLNPVFTLMRSFLDSLDDSNATIHLMADEQALEIVRSNLGISNSLSASPIARKITADSINPNPPNVVLVIMESMSAAKMSRHGNSNHLTPFLDSLSMQSLYFENIYTAGKHTFNGIFGSLFSFPALYRQHPMKNIRKQHGLGTILHQQGYGTIYFTTHDGQFDNVEGFLMANDFDRVVSQSDYPAEMVKTTLGVPDDYLFRFAMPIVDQMHQQGKPFFAAFMTASDHGPFYIPEYFTPQHEETRLGIVEYADWSLKQLIRMAATKPWFDNTIFIFVADHGAPLTATYDLSLDYFHSPLIFYAPGLFTQPETFDCIGGQIDLGPTLMGLLQLPYVNNSLGIDLLRESRPCIFINDDDKIGVLDKEYLLIINDKKETGLYHYPDQNTKNLMNDFQEKAKFMEEYAKANLQVFQWMINHNMFEVTEIRKP